MTKKIGLFTTGPNQDSYLYIEAAAGESYAIGSDDLTANFCVNSSTSPGITPDETTANIVVSSHANGDIDFFPNGTGKTAVLKGNLELTLGTSVYATFAEGALVTNASGITSTVTGTAGFILTANAPGTAPSFQAAPASGISTIDGDTGSATGSTITFDAATQAGTTVNFSATGSTVSLNVTDANNNTIVGLNSVAEPISGQLNTGFGSQVFQNLSSGVENTAFGFNALNAITSNFQNTAIGYQSLVALDSTNNTALGWQSGAALTTGTYNLILGTNTGLNYTTSESSNINLNASSTTVAAENNTLRIGDGTGTGNQQLQAAFISGINGVSQGGTLSLVTINATDQLGSVLTSGVTEVAFQAYNQADQANVTGDGTVYTVQCTNVIFNNGAGYDGTSTFTAPVTGKYLFTMSLQLTGLDVAMVDAIYWLTTTAHTYRLFEGNPFSFHANTGDLGWNGSIIAPMTAGDTATFTIYVAGSTPTVTVVGNVTDGNYTPSFSGVLLNPGISVGTGFTWNEVTADPATINMVANNGYIVNNFDTVTFVLPVSSAVGEVFEVTGISPFLGSGGWTITQNNGQTIHMGSQDTTTGVGGSISSANGGQSPVEGVRLLTVVADTDFRVLYAFGTITIV